MQKRILEIARLAVEANESKQRGFFVDFDEAASTWKTPSELGEPDFRRFRKFAKDFLDETFRQIADLNR